MASTVKNPPAMWEMQVLSLGQEDPLEKGIATHSSVLAWRIPWTEEPSEYSLRGHKELDTTRTNTHKRFNKQTKSAFYNMKSTRRAIPNISSSCTLEAPLLWSELPQETF